MENIMSRSQTLVAQGLAADGHVGGQTRGPSVLVAGASGLVGRAVVRRLAAQSWPGRVTALVRRAGTLTPEHAMPGRLHEYVVDFERLDAPEAQPALAADIVICALGTTLRQAGSEAAFRRVDVEYPAELARRAFAAGAHHFLLVSALGADARSRVFYNRCKGKPRRRSCRSALRRSRWCGLRCCSASGLNCAVVNALRNRCRARSAGWCPGPGGPCRRSRWRRRS